MKRQGAVHNETASAFRDIAYLCQNQGWLNHADWYFRQALLSWEHVRNLYHEGAAMCCSSLALNSYELGLYRDATEQMRRSLMLWEKADENAKGPDTDFVVIYMGWLMTICMASGQFGVAELQTKRTLARCERRYGLYHEGYADIFDDMANLCARTGRLEDAEDYRGRAAVSRGWEA